MSNGPIGRSAFPAVLECAITRFNVAFGFKFRGTVALMIDFAELRGRKDVADGLRDLLEARR